MRLSSPDQPTRLALLFLRLSSLVVDVQPKRGERAQQLGCRFLLALLLIDALSWGAFRLVTLEATIEFIASALVPYVFPCVSSSASFDVPSLGAFCMRVYACTHACALCAALLFAPCILGSGVDKCDESSCLCTNSSESCGLLWTTNGSRHCCVESGFSREFCELPNSGGGTTCPLSYTSTAWLLSAVYCVCYCFLNQLGDAALEMAKTQWLDAFRGTELVPALVQ
ncbi:MAG: hypothetical protein SGPRY_003158 [Prymnesium sp.]